MINRTITSYTILNYFSEKGISQLTYMYHLHANVLTRMHLKQFQ